MSTDAGASAQAEYERRLARHREGVRLRRPRILAAGGCLTLLGLVLGGTAGLEYGGPVIIVTAVAVVSALFGTPKTISAWQTGAVGEVRTGRMLETLGSHGFRILHDRKMPPSRTANIDHIVIGPPGVFVVETKSYKGTLRIRGEEVFVDGRRKQAWIDEVKREAAAVAAALGDELSGHGLSVTPLICVHRADLPLLRSKVQGVAIVSGGGLISRLRRAEVRLTYEEVGRLYAAADARLRPAREQAR